MTESDIISAYSSTLAMFEHLEIQLQFNDEHFSFTSLVEMRTCYTNVEVLISFETNATGIMMNLSQLKLQLALLIELVEKHICSPIANVDHLSPNNGDLKAFSLYSSFERKESDEYERMGAVIQNTLETPKVNGFEDVVGLHAIKKTLKSLVILPKTQPQLFLNRKFCNSILLFGPPGTGKTRLVHALAAQSNAVFHSILASDVLSHYVGQTEKTIKMLFQHLRNCHELTLLFIDEIDSFCRKRTATEQEHTRRIKTELMCQISSTEDCKKFILICATNCPWDLDIAILRRFQKRLYIPLPNELERLEYFEKFARLNSEFDSQHYNWMPLVQRTEKFSYSDLSNVIQNALTIPLMELEDTKVWKHTEDGHYEPIMEGDLCDVICSEMGDLPLYSVKTRKVQMKDLLNAAASATSTVSIQDVEKFENYINVQ